MTEQPKVAEPAAAPFDAEAFEKAMQASLEAPIEPKAEYSTGILEMKSPDGKMQQVLSFKDGKLDGECLTYNAQEVVIQRLNYVAGLLQGMSHTYDDLGELKQDLPYVAGLLHGKLLIYNNGVIVVELPYVVGKREGAAVFYAPNGKKLSEIEFKGDKEDGNHTIYDPTSGAVIHTHASVQGKMQGRATSYYTSGQLMKEEDYDQGLKQGVVKEYFDTGGLMRETKFKDDNPVEAPIQYNSKGEKI